MSCTLYPLVNPYYLSSNASSLAPLEYIDIHFGNLWETATVNLEDRTFLIIAIFTSIGASDIYGKGYFSENQRPVRRNTNEQIFARTVDESHHLAYDSINKTLNFRRSLNMLKNIFLSLHTPELYALSRFHTA